MQQFFFSFTIYFIKISNVSHFCLNLWLCFYIVSIWIHGLTSPICESLYALAVPLCRSLSQPPPLRKWLPRRPQTSFRGLHLSKDWKDGSRKEPDPGSKVDEAGQSTEVLWWPLGTQTCVWPRIVVVKKHLCHIFMGTNPPETLL
jgi:hypothetical protein